MALNRTQAYHLLGLVPGASLDEVKAAYRDLAQVWHPDRFPDNARLREKAVRNQQRINEAYAVLRDDPPPGFPGPAPAPPAAPGPFGQRVSAKLRVQRMRHSLFTGVVAIRHSLRVLSPSATYARRQRRRKLPLAWIVLGGLALALVAAALTAFLYWWW